MPLTAIIGGSGLTRLSELEILKQETVETPYGAPSAALTYGRLENRDLVFLPRHGDQHQIPPHKVNYRANIWALKQAAVDRIIAIAAVGGINSAMAPGKLVLPDQLIDYTYGRKHTFFEDDLEHVTHIEFAEPYDEPLRKELYVAGHSVAHQLMEGATYGATQGPRLETAMEIRRMERDGCDLVGMTGMPEAALARELELAYAPIAVVANWAAGKGEEPITMEEITKTIESGMGGIINILKAYLGQQAA